MDMTPSIKLTVRAFLFAAVLFIGHASFGQGARFMVGAAQRNINPDRDSLYMAGGDPDRPFIDVHDTLFVKAVHVSNDAEDVTILSFDCIGLLLPTLEEIRREVTAALPGFHVAHIVMGSTHTHSGPDVVGIWGHDHAHSGVNEAHMRKIVRQAADAIVDAYRNRQPAALEFAKGTHGEDWVKNISEPGEVDRDLTVLRFRNAKRKNIATITNFACHPTIMDDARPSASADYVWGYYQRLDSLQGGVNMFLQGSIGGWIQPEDVPSGFDNAYYYGSRLGAQALSLLSHAEKNTDGSIRFRSTPVVFPLKNPMFKMAADMGLIKRRFDSSVRSEIAYFTIGAASFATHPGETVPELGKLTKAMMKGRGPKVVIGLGQDALGYILKPYFFDPSRKIPHSEYLTGMSVGPETMGIILETLKRLSSD